jgi:hydrogenase maturation protease
VSEPTLVIGVGNALRGDDGAGLEVARRLRRRAEAAGVAVREFEGEGMGLLDIWQDARAVVLVDSVRSGAVPGTMQRFDVSDCPLPNGLRSSSSTHAVGVGEAIELARELGRLPGRLVLYGVEGGAFETGAELSTGVASIVDSVADAVLHEAVALARPPGLDANRAEPAGERG